MEICRFITIREEETKKKECEFKEHADTRINNKLTFHRWFWFDKSGTIWSQRVSDCRNSRLTVRVVREGLAAESSGTYSFWDLLLMLHLKILDADHIGMKGNRNRRQDVTCYDAGDLGERIRDPHRFLRSLYRSVYWKERKDNKTKILLEMRFPWLWVEHGSSLLHIFDLPAPNRLLLLYCFILVRSWEKRKIGFTASRLTTAHFDNECSSSWCCCCSCCWRVSVWKEIHVPMSGVSLGQERNGGRFCGWWHKKRVWENAKRSEERMRGRRRRRRRRGSKRGRKKCYAWAGVEWTPGEECYPDCISFFNLVLGSLLPN